MTQTDRQEPIAIVGIGCRFPGDATSASKLWNLLKHPHNVATPIPPERFNIRKFYHPDGAHHATTNVLESYFLNEDVRCFDSQFFGIGTGEAEAMDPQHRLLMEVVYEAMESGGFTIDSLRGSDTAVYVGSMTTDYLLTVGLDLNYLPNYTATGVSTSNTSCRVSYFFDWHGPSMTIDTACSSSLVAVHQAVQQLRSGTSRAAVAAGVNLILNPLPFISESKVNMLSPTGRSRMWDADADGYARGEGIAAVILKKLSHAIADGDHIEGVIRETAISHDGKTKGLTMPSGKVQAALIKETYSRAGLDLSKKSDRCQFFEAHGTGTPVGDPQEASALCEAFFGQNNKDEHDTLLAGSAKTVIGHTEGTAGMAGLIKACMALKHAEIPPNMLFNRLSPGVQPFYAKLEIPTKLKAWPALEPNQPRRASVNSFGFGGTNTHAIVESFDGGQKTISDMALPMVPFLFSAASENSLGKLLDNYVSYINESGDALNLRDLGYTLSCKRSALPYKVSISATSASKLCQKIGLKLEEHRKCAEGSSLAIRTTSESETSFLGIFTGQGAQWSAMGMKLILESSFTISILRELDDSLQALPTDDRPSWSIIEQLAAVGADSRLEEAEIAQPLCTALQLVLIQLLRVAAIHLSAVVGHSSGEIAAAHAAGLISAADAIRIAYYRGKYAHLAKGSQGQKGSMLAVGTSFEDAQALCELEDFEGRLSVAAINSPTSVTISGDADVIKLAKTVFDDEKKFCRMLKVDTAYHSKHMVACAEPYLRALKKCGIEVLQPTAHSPIWYSSVHAGQPMLPNDMIQGQYWVQNMTEPVMFYQALKSTLQCKTTFHVALEIGPHPALKGPVSDTIQEALGSEILYFGTISRGKDDVEAFTETLGKVWTLRGATSVDFEAFQKALYDDRPQLLTNLPTYPWDHDRVLWAEPRTTRNYLRQDETFHDLLGTRSPDGTEAEWRWHNVLKAEEIPWLSCHALQGQTIYPATGYIVLAMEASLQIASKQPVQLIELERIEIRKALAIHAGTGAEILVTMTNMSLDVTETIRARFTCFSAPRKEASHMVVNCIADVIITLGEPCEDILSPRSSSIGLANVDVGRFYNAMEELGYIYDGVFKTMFGLQRKFDVARGFIPKPSRDAWETPFLIHPGTLDTAVQGMFAAYSAPGDERLRIQEKIIEIEGIHFVPFSTTFTPSNDRPLFARASWAVESPSGELAVGSWQAPTAELQKVSDLERCAFYFLKTLKQTLDPEEWIHTEIPSHHRALFDWVDEVLSLVKRGKHPYIKKEWQRDRTETIYNIIDSYSLDVDFQLLQAVGENLVSTIRGSSTMLEHMTKHNRLENYYRYGQGLTDLSKWTAEVVAQISDRYPQMNIIEVGAGTGGSTAKLLPRLDKAFASYTFTDISAGFFETAATYFESYSDRMIYKPLDIEADPTLQGFEEKAYNLVVAANVLHATKDLAKAVRNTRQLLKPGGYLVVMEVVDNGPIRVGFIQAGLPGWWIGSQTGRRYAPTVSLAEWDYILRANGFSGIDSSTPVRNALHNPASVFVSQAVDDDIRILRSPLGNPGTKKIQDLVLFGGQGKKSSQIFSTCRRILEAHASNIIIIDSLDHLTTVRLPENCTTLALSELDSPVFKDLNSTRWTNLKTLLSHSDNVLWTTQGARCENPYAAMTIGLFRSIAYEFPLTQFQILEFKVGDIPKPEVVAEQLLRLHITQTWKKSNTMKDILWTTEPELVVEDNVVRILRIKPHQEQNDRYNSIHRFITKSVDTELSNVHLTWQHSAYAVRETEIASLRSPENILINVDFSLLCALNTRAGRLHLSLGKDAKSGERQLSLSEIQAVKISPRKSRSIPVSLESETVQPYLSFVTAYIICERILSIIPSRGTMVVHEPDPVLARILSRKAAQMNAKLVYTTTSKPELSRPNWLYLHSRSPKRIIERVLPKGTSVFLDLAGHSAKDLTSRIIESLPSNCEKYDPSFIISTQSYVNDDSSQYVNELLRQADAFAMEVLHETPDGMPLPIIQLEDILLQEVDAKLVSIVEWHGASSVEVEVEPIDRHNDLFRDDKSYWLAGLAGDVGWSLCDWMIRHGAKHIVLTSRNPQVPTDWLEHHASNGIRIACIKADITDLEDVKRAHQEICDTLPQIAGVANGALILRDRAMMDTDYETLLEVTRPKVEGTLNLDHIFSDGSLEWFIALTSVAATTGNVGQMAYTAANCFQGALMKSRRNRGLAGSSIDISNLVGVGYIARESRGGKLTAHQADRLIKRSRLLPMSERDLHQLFAEAIISGRPNSGLDAEIITGLQQLDAKGVKEAFWGENPKFSQWIHDQRLIGIVNKQKAKVSIRDNISNAKNDDDIFKIVQDGFIEKLKLGLYSSSSDGETIDVSMALADIGVDSLIAVVIRNWALQELSVDLPVLKILGGDSTADIVGDITRQLLAKGSTEDSHA